MLRQTNPSGTLPTMKGKGNEQESVPESFPNGRRKLCFLARGVWPSVIKDIFYFPTKKVWNEHFKADTTFKQTQLKVEVNVTHFQGWLRKGARGSARISSPYARTWLFLR